MKYHVNPDSGVVGPCRAKVKCRFGGVTGKENHFESKEAADRASEALMAKKHQMPALKKQASTSVDNFEKTKTDIVKGLKAAGIIKDAKSLPAVASESEIIEKWFKGDAKKYALVARIANDDELKRGTKKSVGKFINQNVDVAMVANMDFSKKANPEVSDVALIDELDDNISLEDFKAGRVPTFKLS